MRILVVNDELNYQTSSVPRIAYLSARHLVSLGHEVTLVGTVRDRAREGESRGDGLAIASIYSDYRPRFRPWRGLYNPLTVPKFRRLLARTKPDIVHFHNVHSHISFACLRLARRAGARVFLTAHDVMLFWDGKLDCFDRTTTLADVASAAVDYRYRWWRAARTHRFRYLPLRNAIVRRTVQAVTERLISVSHALSHALRANDYPSATTIYNGTSADLEASPADIDACKRRFGLNGHTVVLGGGRLSYLKGMDHLLRAVALLRKDPIKLLLIGRGSPAYEEHLRAMAAQLGIEAKVVFAGWIAVDQLPGVLAASDVCVNPSLCFETLSMFNLEAMMASKPVVSTFFGGPAETIVDGDSGFFVNPHDVETMAERIRAVAANAEQARDMGASGRKRALREFDLATQMAKVADLYG